MPHPPTTTTNRKGRLHLLRKILRRGAAHPIQVSVVHLVPRGSPSLAVDEVIVHKVLLRTDGRVRELRVPEGRYALRAREVPLGCNVQGQELLVDVTADDTTYVFVKTGTYLQVWFAGFGGCLLPATSRWSTKAFYFDHVSREAFEHELQRVPALLKALQDKLGLAHEGHEAGGGENDDDEAAREERAAD